MKPRTDILDHLRRRRFESGVLALACACYLPELGAQLLAQIDAADFGDDDLGHAWAALGRIRAANARAGLASLETQNLDPGVASRVRALRNEVQSGGVPDPREHFLLTKAAHEIAKQLSASIGALTQVEGATDVLQEVWGATSFQVTEILGSIAPPPPEMTLAELAIAELDRQESSWEASYGVPLLDSRTGGLHPGTLHLVIASTGGGKSSLAMSAALATAHRGHRVLYVTKEMLRAQCAVRFASMCSGKPKWQLHQERRQGLLTAEDLRRMMPDGIRVMDGLNTIPAISAEAHRAELAGEPYHLVIIDYLQQYKGSGESEVQRLDIAIEHAKNLALQRQVAVLCPAQLNRGIDPDTIPDLHHIRGSGAIEQWADVVVALRNTRRAVDESGNSTDPYGEDAAAFVMHAAIRKAREGTVGNVWSDEDGADGVDTLKMGRGTYRFWQSRWSPWCTDPQAVAERNVETKGSHWEAIP